MPDLHSAKFHPSHIVEVAAAVKDSLGKTLPRGLIRPYLRTKLRDRGLHRCAKLIIAEWLAASAQDRELARDEALLRETIKRGQEFAPGQVTGGAENNYHRGRRRRLETHARAQRVGNARDYR